MEYCIALSEEQERTLKQAYQTRPSYVRVPSHIILLTHQGYPAEKIAEITYTTTRDVDDAVRAFQVGGIAAIVNPK